MQGVRNFAAPARGPSQPRADPDQGSRSPPSQRRRAKAEHGCVKTARALYGTACNFSAPAGLSPRGCWFEPDNLKDRSAKQGHVQQRAFSNRQRQSWSGWAVSFRIDFTVGRDCFWNVAGQATVHQLRHQFTNTGCVRTCDGATTSRLPPSSEQGRLREPRAAPRTPHPSSTSPRQAFAHRCVRLRRLGRRRKMSLRCKKAASKSCMLTTGKHRTGREALNSLARVYTKHI